MTRRGAWACLAAFVLLAGAGACGAGGGASDSQGIDLADVVDVPEHPDVPEVADVTDVPDAALDAPDDTPAADLPPDVPVDAPFDVPSDVAPDLPWAPASPGGFRRIGDAVVDEAGRSVILHGVNASNVAKYQPDHLTWETASDFQALAAAGFNNVRLLTFWGAVMPDEGVIDTVYLDALAQRVQWAADAGLLVILDMHQDIYGFGFGDNGAPAWACDAANYAAYVPKEPWYLNYLSPQVRACFDRFYADDVLFARFTDAWLALALRFKDHPGVLGFDLLNEPNPGTFEASRFVPDLWQPRQEQLAAAMAGVAPDRLVYFQGATMLAYGVVDEFVPSPEPRVAFAPHYYLPTIHDGGVYDHDASIDFIDAAFDAVATSAANLGGVPVWMGEWGGPTAIPGFDRYLEDVLSRFVQHRWSWAVYSDDRTNNDGFGIRNLDGTFNPMVVQRLGHPHARRVPGPIHRQSLVFESDGRQTYQAAFPWSSTASALEGWSGPTVVGGATTCLLTPPGGVATPCDTFPCAQRSEHTAGVLRACAPPDSAPGEWVVDLQWTPVVVP
jgi:endoglycosylceramidase